MSVEELVFLEVVASAEFGASPPLNRQTIEAALRRPLAAFAGELLYSTPFARAAVLMSALMEVARDRLALLVGALWLEKEGWRLAASAEELYAIAASASVGATDVDGLADWLRGNVARLAE